MSFSGGPISSLTLTAVSEFQYRQLISLPVEPLSPEEAPSLEDFSRADEVRRRELEAERATATAEAERRLASEHGQALHREKERIAEAIASFELARKEYFTRVEREVVQLSLAIAAKILHRESQVDPLLVSTLVRIALDQLREGTVASIRVRPEEAGRWNAVLSAEIAKGTVGIVQDASLSAGDCILDTPLGSVNFSLEAQLKEVERGFLDVLAQRPA